jgi:hypothetical protein
MTSITTHAFLIRTFLFNFNADLKLIISSINYLRTTW